MQEIYLRNVPPPLETLEHVAFLWLFAEWLKPERYLELGVRDGKCFQQIALLAKEAIAVDMVAPMFTVPDNATYITSTTDAYFDSIRGTKPRFDMVFIDADHSYAQSYKDFINVKDYVIPDGMVFFHDTYPYSEELLQPHFCGDSYKTAIKIREEFGDEWEILTLPFNPGLSIAKKIYNKKGLPFQIES